jgi:hypothetical protein
MVAITLNNQAAPVPNAINVNMFSFKVRTEVAPRTKNGQPAHNTTGVAKTSWIHEDVLGETAPWSAGIRSPPIARTRTGTDSATATQNRRVMPATLRRRCLLLGVPEQAVMGLMGWSNSAMAARYQHITAAVQRDVARRVGGLLWQAERSVSDDK